MKNKKLQIVGISFMKILFLILLVLKLCNVIDYSWWWITCPLWIGFALYIAVIILIIITAGIIVAIKRIKSNF